MSDVLEMPANHFFILLSKIDLLQEDENYRQIMINNFNQLKDDESVKKILFPTTHDIRDYHHYSDNGEGIALLKKVTNQQ